MGPLFRIAGGVWIGIGIINVYLADWDQGLSDRALVNNMIVYGIPGLLLLIFGGVIRKRP